MSFATAPDPIAAFAVCAAAAKHGGAVTTLWADDCAALHTAHVALEARATNAETQLAAIRTAARTALVALDAGAKPSDPAVSALRASVAQ